MYSAEIEGDTITIRGPYVCVDLEGEEAGEIIDELEEAETVGEIQAILEQAVRVCSVR